MKNVQLELNDIIIHEENFPGKLTSLQRYQNFVNDTKFIETYEITNMHLQEQKDEFRAHLGPIYFNKSLFSSRDPEKRFLVQNIGKEEDLISKDPIAWVYSDGGLEYFIGFKNRTTDKPLYQCVLWIPQIKSTLTYCLPVKDKDLIARIKR